MNKKPSISVIMPVYNMELYVGEAIESILNQTFVDFEFIIIDDGSTDNTLNIIRSYNDDRIICLQNERNLGNYPSRNKGMRIAKGKYIAVMDGDDVAMPERLEKQFLFMEKHKDMVAAGTDFRYTVKSREGGQPLKHHEVMLSLLNGYKILHPSLFMRKNIVMSLNGYNEYYTYASDYDLTCRLILLGKMEIIPEILMTYRKHTAQITTHHSDAQIKFATEIRQKYQILFVNKYKGGWQNEVGKLEVGIPLLGSAIGFYTYARHANDSKIEKLADSMVDHIYKKVNSAIPACVNDGLCGLGYGLLYLLRNGFVEGNEDDVLSDIDRTIASTLKQEKDMKWKKEQACYLKSRQKTNFKNPKGQIFINI